MFSPLPRALAAAFITALVVTSLPPAVVAQTVTVKLNGQPLYLNPAPIEREGRVFVPLRGVFEHMGASVVYSAGTINATKQNTTVQLRVGSTQATVNGQTQTLDVAPFIIGASTYVPLRFIAQAFGAQVGWDSPSRVVTINMPVAGPVVPPPPARPPYPPPASMVYLRAQQPPPGARVQGGFVTVSAQFSHRVNPGSVRVRLDGNDVTQRSDVSPSGFSYTSRAPLLLGSHEARVAGHDAGGVGFERSWSFNVIRSGPVEIHLTISQPGPNAVVGRSFTIQGNTVGRGHLTVTIGAAPSYAGLYNGSTDAGPQGNFKMEITLFAPPGLQAIGLKVTASDPASSQTVEKTLQLRVQ
ncbi:MAG: copper amine oxidase N-terminal domain-containing protein [Candidatus Cybelea sp.]